MEAIPFWAVLLALCGGIVTIMSAIEKIVNAGKVINSPYSEHNRRISEWLCVKTSKARGYVAGKYVKNKK